MKRALPLLLLLLIKTIIALSQERYPNTFLWKITGKGLSKPSYVFGTMHLNDKRIFKFGDSTYGAIERTEGFAMEVNPDELAAYMVNNMFEGKEKKKMLKDVLTADDFRKYAPLLSKKIGKPAIQISVEDILTEKNKWITEYMAKGEMPTFIDAYLYNIAKQQGKWVGGIEDLEDQTGLMNEITDVTDIEQLVNGDDDAKNIEKGFQDFINTYITEDLNKVLLIGNSTNHKDEILTRRNVKMARRMDSLSAIRSTFFAVGVAHLPGDSGVISLLKSRGFTVEPVIPSKRIEPSAYKYKKAQPTWIEVKDSAGLYTIQMPGKPVSVKMYGLLEVKFLLDIAGNTGYSTMAIVTPYARNNPDSVLDSFAKSFAQGKSMTGKRITAKGLTGKEYNITDKTATGRVRVMVKNNVVYALIMFGLNKTEAFSPDTEKFFNSFEPHDVKVETKAEGTIYRFHNKDIPASFESPVPLEFAASLSEQVNGWDIKTFAGADNTTGNYYLFLEKKVQKGYNITSDTALLEEMKTNMAQKFSKMISEEAIQLKNGKGIKITAEINESAVKTQILLVSRDHRCYYLSATYTDAAAEPDIDKYFRSFEHLPYSTDTWKKQTAREEIFSTWAPSAFEWQQNEEGNTRSQITFDEPSSLTFSIFTDTLSKYYWAVSDSAFWASRINNYNSEEDSVTQVVDILNGTAPGKEIIVRKINSANQQRVRLIRNGDVVFYLHGSGTSDLLHSENIERFFADFTFREEKRPSDIISSKTDRILTDLLSSDSLTRAQAYVGLRAASFRIADLPLLHVALYKTYQKPWDEADENLINTGIADGISGIADSTSVAFVLSKYPGLQRDDIKWTTLRILANIQTQHSYNSLRSLLTQYPLPKTGDHNFGWSLRDSLALTATIFKDLLVLVPDTIISLSLVTTGKELLDSGLFTSSELAMYSDKFIALANAYATNAMNLTENTYDYQLSKLVSLLDTIRTPAALKAVRKFLNSGSAYLKKDAALVLLKNKQAVDPAIIVSLAANKNIRGSLYDELKQMGKLSLFPAQYATQKMMAESEAWIIANDDDEPNAISLVGERIASYKGKNYKFYLFKVSFLYEGASTSYLVIAGGYDIAGKKMLPVESLSSLYTDEEYNAKDISRLFRAWLDQYKEDYENEIIK